MLKKLSLAALVAMGSMSFASATPLTEAIKNVNFGGYLRERFYHHSEDKTGYTTKWRTTALFKFSVPVSEELKFNTAYAFDWSINNNAGILNEATNKPTGGAPAAGNVKFFLQYSKDGANVIVGKIPVPTPVTATGVGEATAAGAIATYKVNDNIVVAAAGLDNLLLTDQVGVGGNNTAAAAVIYKKDALAAQLWYFNVNDILDSDVVARADYKVNGIALHADFATAKLDDTHVTTAATSLPSMRGKKTNVKKTQTYFNVSAAYAQDQLSGKIGYAQTGKDGGIVTLDVDSPLSAVTMTQQIYSITDAADTSMIYGNVGYKVDAKTLAYVADANINDEKSKTINDFIVGVKYKYTKKMNFHVYYDMLNADNGNAFNKSDNNEFRFEAKYTF